MSGTIMEWSPDSREQGWAQNKIDSTALKWDKLRTLSNCIFGSTTRLARPRVFASTDELIAIGTESAQVAVFNWSSQSLVCTLGPPPSATGRIGPITCIAISRHNEILVGSAEGHIVSWNLKGHVLLHVAPIMSPPPENTTENHLDGHVVGSHITFVGFGPNGRIISADSRGLVFEHYLIRVLLEQKVRSKRLLGKHSIASCVLAAKLVEIGRCMVLFVLMPHTFVAYSLGTAAHPRGIQFVLPRIEGEMNVTLGMSGSLSWNASKNYMVVCWANTLRMMCFEWSKGTFKITTPKLLSTTERLCKFKESIVKVDFLNECIVVLLTVTEQTIIFDLDEMVPLQQQDTKLKHIIHTDLYSQALQASSDSVVTDFYEQSLQVHGMSILILGQYEFYVGTFSNWADQLMHYLKNSEPVNAIKLAIHYWMEKDNLELVGLGPNHKSLVLAALPEVILTSLGYALRFSGPDISKILDASLEAIVQTGVPLLEQIFDLLEPHQDIEVLYLHKIKVLAIDEAITFLPPRIFQRMVQLLAANKNFTELEELLLSLDITTLDINLVFDLCRKHNLVEIELFLSGVALRDFVSPLTWPTDKRYKFLEYTLCGRIYPLGRSMDAAVHAEACRDIYRGFFIGEDHAKLTELVTASPDAFFNVMEKFFDQNYLDKENSEHINRQTVIAVLKQLHNEHQELRVYYDIFLSRALTKYSQFLIVSSSELTQVVQDLCSPPAELANGPTREEREGAIISILPFLRFPDPSLIIGLLNEARFFNALEKFYFLKERYADLVQTCVYDMELNGKFDDFWTIVDTAITKDPKSANILLENVALIIENDPTGLADLTNAHLLHGVFDRLEDPENTISDKSALVFLNKISDLRSTHKIPPQSATSKLFKLLAEEKNTERILYLLTEKYNEPDDIDFEAVQRVFKLNSNARPLVLLMTRTGRDQEAMDYISKFIQSGDNNQEVSAIISDGINVCKRVSERSLPQSEKLWQQLLTSLISANVSPHNTLYHLVQWSLELDTNQVDTARIVISAAENTQKWLIVDYLTIISNEILLLSSLKRLPAATSSKALLELTARRLLGWTFTSGECESCGEKLFGLGVKADELYHDWQKYLELGSDALSASTIVLFKCGHAYHRRCLMKYRLELECIMCQNIY